MEPFSLPTKIVYHSDFLNHYATDHHPERPSRLMVIIDSLQREGLYKSENHLIPQEAPASVIALAHDKDYILLVEREAEICKLHGIKDGSYLLSTGDVYLSPDSYHVAKLAAGAATLGADTLYSHKAPAVFCAVRPPGHHACFKQGMGFCLFNNAVIAARYAQQKHGIKNVLIIDWDVHHGNGTAELAWNDSSLFYFSTHQYPLYPGTGARNETGCGNILNCPIPSSPHSREDVLKAFREELPAFYKKAAPELVIISAGFDAHYMDPLGGFNLTKEDFGELTRLVLQLSQKTPILSLLEGGYHLQGLAESAVEHVKALNYFFDPLGCSKL